MYKVKASMPVNGPGWGLEFKDGVAFTEREDLARRLRSLGYEVEEGSAPSAPPDASATPSEEDADRPLFCAICNRPFGSQAALTRHVNKMH